jgi:DNA-binding GntR family transcriptional regulator
VFFEKLIAFQKLEPISKKTRIVALLWDAVISSTIRSGEQIVEEKLAQQLGVGQGAMREALIKRLVIIVLSIVFNLIAVKGIINPF